MAPALCTLLSSSPRDLFGHHAPPAGIQALTEHSAACLMLSVSLCGGPVGCLVSDGSAADR